MNIKTDINKPSARHGYWFYFDIEGIKITAFGSAFSGKEIIFIDDDIVSECRSYRVSNGHKFEYQGSQYEVRFTMQNILTGNLICEVFKDGKKIATENKAYFGGSDTSTKTTLLWLFVIGAASGVGFYTMGYWLGRFLAN